jgi:hypothetical protein
MVASLQVACLNFHSLCQALIASISWVPRSIYNDHGSYRLTLHPSISLNIDRLSEELHHGVT